MAASGRATGATPAPEQTATALRDAPLVRILTRRDGDAIAAAGLLARTLADLDTPFHVAPTASRVERARRVQQGDPEATTVAIGAVERADITIAGENATATAVAIARAADSDPAPTLALAGVIAAGGDPTTLPTVLDQAQAQGIHQRPGVGIPTSDPIDGVAASLWIHAEFSGHPDQLREELVTVGIDPDGWPFTESERRKLASLIAIRATEGPAPMRAATSINRLLRPYVGEGPFPTVEGYAEVLDAVAREHPGTAITVAIGETATDAAEQSWRTHAQAVHAAIDAASITRVDDLAVITTDTTRTLSTARVLQRSHVSAPVTVVIGSDSVALVGNDNVDLRAATTALAETVEGTSDGTRRYGLVTHNVSLADQTVIDTVTDHL